MKRIFCKILVIVGVIATVACNNATEKVETAKTTNVPDSTGDFPPLDSLLVPDNVADMYMNSFDSMSKKLIPGSQKPTIKAFTIRAEELLAAMGLDPALAKNTKYNCVRAYFGYDADPESSKTGFKLYIVPVEGADVAKGFGGYDMRFNSQSKIVPKKGGKGKVKGIDDEDEFVMDLNAPCPNTCPEN